MANSPQSNFGGRISERLFISFFLIIGMFGLASPYNYNVLPANFLFEALLFLIPITIIKLPKRDIAPFAIIAILYVAASYISSAIRNPTHILDFAQAYKAFIYVLPLSFIYNRNLFDRDRMVFFLKIIILLFFLKYSYSILLKIDPQLSHRPGIYTENNFELIFLLIAFYILKDDFQNTAKRWFALIAAIVVISGSRSSIVALLIIYWGIYLNRLTYRTLLYLVIYSILIGIAAYIFSSRLGEQAITDVDRYRFFQVFLDEVRAWSVIDFISGSQALTPLSPISCASLVYYESLFSFSDDGSCYSVILHSYFLRVLFDHGVAGLIFLIWFIARALRGCNYNWTDVSIILGVLLSTALSVSAMNSIFSSLAIALAIGLKPGKTQFPNLAPNKMKSTDHIFSDP